MIKEFNKDLTQSMFYVACNNVNNARYTQKILIDRLWPESVPFKLKAKSLIESTTHVQELNSYVLSFHHFDWRENFFGQIDETYPV